MPPSQLIVRFASAYLPLPSLAKCRCRDNAKQWEGRRGDTCLQRRCHLLWGLSQPLVKAASVLRCLSTGRPLFACPLLSPLPSASASARSYRTSIFPSMATLLPLEEKQILPNASEFQWCASKSYMILAGQTVATLTKLCSILKVYSTHNVYCTVYILWRQNNFFLDF